MSTTRSGLLNEDEVIKLYEAIAFASHLPEFKLAGTCKLTKEKLQNLIQNPDSINNATQKSILSGQLKIISSFLNDPKFLEKLKMFILSRLFSGLMRYQPVDL